MKRSTNFNRHKKVGRSAADVADLMQHFGITADELREYQKKKAGTIRKRYVCSRCRQMCESEVSNYDNSTTCPFCENVVIVA